jgi:N6-adenosine-specific RNA methylase IME4
VKKYNVIYADPPWPGNPTLYKDPTRPGKVGRPALTRDTAGFDLMSHAAIEAMPVADLVADDAMLFMWVIGRSLEWAPRIMRAWGFVYKSIGFTWVKPTKSGGFVQGMGYWTRQNAELCLIGARGSPQRFAVPNNARPSVPSVICEARRELVRKPDCVRDHITTLVGRKATKLEMFARTTAPGWDVFGNDVESTAHVHTPVKIGSTKVCDSCGEELK